MKAASVLLASLLIAAPVAGPAEMIVQTCFSPQMRCSAYIVREIDAAKKELLIAVYAFTSQELAEAVIRAKKRGLTVQVILDRQFDAGNERSKGKFLETHKVAVRRVSGASSETTEAGLMHQKFAVIDRQLVLTGSYNWTHSADRLNDENVLFFRAAESLAEEYRKAFVRLWERKG